MRIAPLTFSFSSAITSISLLCIASSRSWRCICSSSSWAWKKWWTSFSTPSKHRKLPPISISVTMIGTATPRLRSHTSSALMASAAGTRIALLTSEPLATAQITGSSRAALTPVTCCAFKARSSPSTPAVFLAASLVNAATSSSRVAISSISTNRLAPAIRVHIAG